MNALRGSGCVALGPPAMISGSSSPRALERSGMPPGVRASTRMLEKASSNWSEKPTTSNSAQRPQASRASAGAHCACAARPPCRSRARSSAPPGACGVSVHDRVEDLEAQVAHAHVVDVRERQAERAVRRLPVLHHLTVLTTQITRGFGHALDERGVGMFAKSLSHEPTLKRRVGNATTVAREGLIPRGIGWRYGRASRRPGKRPGPGGDRARARSARVSLGFARSFGSEVVDGGDGAHDRRARGVLPCEVAKTTLVLSRS